MRYAVFGEHRFCPVCGRLPAAWTAMDSLEAEASRLDALDDLPPDTRGLLREQGVLDRQYVDTIENVVGVVEALASAVFVERVSNAAELTKGKGNVFQRLDDLADLFSTRLSKDLPSHMGSRWAELQRAWAGLTRLRSQRWCRRRPLPPFRTDHNPEAGSRYSYGKTTLDRAIVNAPHAD